ncbi:50S ribosomal protein L33 [Cohnella laeviribosi]|uniref:50S ribosomal protein L33 n=1 Tax=Cohnella laeviribosi TaxID=380174 RepID=UPI003D24BE6D
MPGVISGKSLPMVTPGKSVRFVTAGRVRVRGSTHEMESVSLHTVKITINKKTHPERLELRKYCPRHADIGALDGIRGSIEL